jgi:hypothetical protein
MTEPIVAAATMILAEECKLRLDEPVVAADPNEISDRLFVDNGKLVGASALDILPLPTDREDYMAVGFTGNSNVWLSKPVNDTCLSHIIRRHLHLHSIPHGQTNKPLSHLSRDMGKYKMVIGKLHPKHCSREYRGNFSFNDD